MKKISFLTWLVCLHSVTLFLLPLYIVRFSFFGLPLTLLEVFILISVFSTIVYCVKKQGSAKSFRTFFDVPLLFLLLAAFLSLFVTPDVRGGLGIFKAYFLEPILFYYSLVFVARETKRFKFILWGLIGSVLLVAILGLVQKASGQFIFAEHEWIQGRISTFYNSVNAVALFIGPMIPLLVVYLFKAKQVWRKIIFGGMVLFLTVIIFWTKSKGGILAEIFSLGVLAYGLLSTKIDHLKKYWYVVPIAFVICAATFFGYVYLLYEPTIQNNGAKIEDDTLQIRYATWFSTKEILAQDFVLGTGLNGFKFVYNNYKLADYQEDFQYPHTIVFNFWTETGILGLVSFSILLLYCFFVCMQLNKKGTNLISLGLIGAFAYIVVHGLVDVPYFKNDLAVQFWALVAVTQLLRDIKQNS